MTELFHRSLAREIIRLKDKFPILAVTGPRQSGKTTLLKSLFPDFTYVSLEDFDNRTFAEQDPKGFLQKYSEKTIFDEVQRVPALFSYLQTTVDASGQMGQFILSGSQNFHLLKSITQSLAGRVALFKLLPLDNDELADAGLLPDHYTKACIHGAYPAIYHREINPLDYYASYVQTYIEKDVTELVNIHDMQTFRTFLGLCAGRAGQLLNLSALANECDISQPTAKSWLSILESSYIVFLLHPYHENFSKRLVKTPKLYFYDTGLLSFLLEISTPDDLLTNRLKGNIFENMIIANFIKVNAHRYLHRHYYFWQDHRGLEVDLLRKTGSDFEVYEIKSTQTVTHELFKGLQNFSNIAQPNIVHPFLVYGGDDHYVRSNVQVLGWKDANGIL